MAGHRILYFIGKRPARPVRRAPHKSKYGECHTKWKRDWLPLELDAVVFLSPRPQNVFQFHGKGMGCKGGRIYAYKVPNWIIKKAHGIHKFDDAQEILIPESLWRHVQFLGQTKSSKRNLDVWRRTTSQTGVKWSRFKFMLLNSKKRNSQ